ncbi:hypothetical protein FQA39_LY04918 [Lamprigera yunnana]|nr:hypothetical protein FQA39_LY04918 [Lamprigera yunnana]
MRNIIGTCLIIFFVQAFAEQSFDEIVQQCSASAGIEANLVDRNIDKKLHITTGNTDINNYIECVARAMGSIVKDEFDFVLIKKEMIAKLMPIMSQGKEITNADELADKAIAKCKNIVASSLGDRMIKFHNCVVDVIAESKV